MKKKKVELQVVSISNSHAQAGAYALLLEEKDGDRQLPVIIGTTEAQALVMELRGIVPPRPFTHTLFASVIEVLGAHLLRVLIYKADNGVFYSYIYLRQEETIYRIDSRTSDAIILALRMDAPILIYESILEAEHIKTGGEDSYKDNTDTTGHAHTERELNSLKAALQKAVKDENYEQAALLRDQINHFQKSE